MIQNIIRLCEQGKFADALDAIDKVIKEGKLDSNIYRIRGQANLELGNTEESVNDLIESLRLNKANIEALTLIGNIYAHKEDFTTSLKYLEKVVDIDSSNFLAFSNIAGIYAKQEDYLSAIRYFDSALSLNNTFINALYGKALCLFNTDKKLEAFDILIDTLKTNSQQKESQLYELSFQLAKKVALKIAETFVSSKNQVSLVKALKSKTKYEIKSSVDNSIGVPAKLEVAEYYDREYHSIKYKTDNKLHPHYYHHELTHLKLIIEAREEESNELFTASEKNYKSFKENYKAIYRNCKKIGITDEDVIEGLFKKLYNGLNLQIFNAPIDLFIEDYLYNEFRELRPIQFLSLIKMNEEVMHGQTNKEIIKLVPQHLRDANLLLAIPQLILFKELYGYDYMSRLSSSKLIKKGKQLFELYSKMRFDRQAGEEYDLIRWWAEDLGIEYMFELKEEKLSNALDKQIDRIESDPFNLHGDSSEEDAEMQKFVETHSKDNLNMAVVFHMVSALSYFKKLELPKIKEIGFEIAMIGRTGIDPSTGDKYNLSTVEGKEFSGWKMLSWMYVSWSQFEPSMVDSFQLNFEEEFQLAKSLI